MTEKLVEFNPESSTTLVEPSGMIFFTTKLVILAPVAEAEIPNLSFPPTATVAPVGVYPGPLDKLMDGGTGFPDFLHADTNVRINTLHIRMVINDFFIMGVFFYMQGDAYR